LKLQHTIKLEYVKQVKEYLTLVANESSSPILFSMLMINLPLWVCSLE